MSDADNCGDKCLDWQESSLAWESLGIGRSLVFLAVQMAFFWLLIIMIETDIIRKLLYKIRPKVHVDHTPKLVPSSTHL